ncbi:hypothetical protein DFH09DRAFT_1204206 [Mycena vulgaris]|nr:hypothetical protein DFH09DRAFT_1204206 [Mycena vulgaris]
MDYSLSLFFSAQFLGLLRVFLKNLHLGPASASLAPRKKLKQCYASNMYVGVLNKQVKEFRTLSSTISLSA